MREIDDIEISYLESVWLNVSVGTVGEKEMGYEKMNKWTEERRRVLISREFMIMVKGKMFNFTFRFALR